MELTNLYNLPESIVNIVMKGIRRPEPGVFHVTDLAGDPTKRILQERHWDEITADVSEFLWMLLGTSVHYILKGGAPDWSISEQQFEVRVGPYKITGTLDLYHRRAVEDWKVTSVFAFLLGEKKDWTAQLNIYKWLIWTAKKLETDLLRINAILRDHVKSKALSDPDYPKIPFLSVEIKPWDTKDTLAYILAWLREYEARTIELRPCSDENRWARPTTYAVVKPGNKRATKVCDTSDEAKKWIAENEVDKKGKPVLYNVQERPGVYARCKDYCQVRAICEFNLYRGQPESEFEDE